MDRISIAARTSASTVRTVALALAVIITCTTNIYAKLTTAAAAPTSVLLTWTAPGDDGSVGTASQYDLRYSTSMITESNWGDATVVTGLAAPQPAGSSEAFYVAGLTPGTLYYFAIRAADEVPNWSPISNVVSITTDQETEAPANVADLNVVERYRYSVLLGWTAPGDDGSVGTATTYDIRYHTATITEANWDSAVQVSNEPAPSLAGTPETLTVAGLAESTQYYFALKTADEVPNWSGLSNVASTTTRGDETPPATIEDLQASSGVNQGEIDLSWTAPGDDDLVGTVTRYDIRFSMNPITTQNWDSATACPEPPSPLVPGEEQVHTLCDLSAGEMYYVCIRAVDDADNMGAMSNVDTAIAKFSFISGVDDDQNGLPDRFTLAQNYPNPFNPSTEIDFALPRSCRVTVDVYNTVGQKVATLVDGQLPAGYHAITWNGTGAGGQSLATGVYFYRLQAEDYLETKKMVLLK